MNRSRQRSAAATNRRGATLVHLQTAMAVGAIVISCVAASIAALYRMQETSDSLRERSAVAYRFEHRFRADARAASSVELTEDGELRFSMGDRVVKYVSGDDGRLVREEQRGDKTSYDQLVAPTEVRTNVGYDEGSRTASLTISAAAGRGAAPGVTRRIRALVGRPNLAGRAD